jgi:hypothetical protein
VGDDQEVKVISYRDPEIPIAHLTRADWEQRALEAVREYLEKNNDPTQGYKPEENRGSASSLSSSRFREGCVPQRRHASL